jgi:hypothetical protein
MIRTVEVVDPAGGDQAVLYSPQGVGRSAAHHEGSAVEVFLMDQVFSGQSVIILCDQVNMTRIEVMYGDARDLPGLFLQGKQDICLFTEE